MTPHDGDSAVDVGSLGLVDASDIAVYPVDQLPDSLDYFSGRTGVDATPRGKCADRVAV